MGFLFGWGLGGLTGHIWGEIISREIFRALLTNCIHVMFNFTTDTSTSEKNVWGYLIAQLF